MPNHTLSETKSHSKTPIITAVNGNTKGMYDNGAFKLFYRCCDNRKTQYSYYYPKGNRKDKRSYAYGLYHLW